MQELRDQYEGQISSNRAEIEAIYEQKVNISVWFNTLRAGRFVVNRTKNCRFSHLKLPTHISGTLTQILALQLEFSTYVILIYTYYPQNR